MIIDVHCHVGQSHRPWAMGNRFSFEPAGRYALGDACFSERLQRSMGMRLARALFRVKTDCGDADIENRLLGHILGATTVDRVVLLAFDQYHTEQGDPIVFRGKRDTLGTDYYVSNTYIHSLWRRYPQRILFGASIHPYRHLDDMTATDMLAEVAGAGAVLIKWLPQTQNINVEDPRSLNFMRAACRLGLPFLMHYGPELALGHSHREYVDPAGLLRALRLLRKEGEMPTVIIAHAATPSFWPVGRGRYFHGLVNALLGEFSDAPLYADIAALAAFNKARWLKRLSRMPGIQNKLVYGSDFPVPPTPLAFWFQLGLAGFKKIRGQKSWLDRDLAIKKSIGLDPQIFSRGGILLQHRIARADSLVGLV